MEPATGISAAKVNSHFNVATCPSSPLQRWFISGGARFWAGAFAGKSALLMRVRLTDAATGTVIAEPEFYQHAAAMSGAWSVGGADNAMLARTTTLIAEYLAANQAEAVGGPTSMVDEKDPKSKD